MKIIKKTKGLCTFFQWFNSSGAQRVFYIASARLNIFNLDVRTLHPLPQRGNTFFTPTSSTAHTTSETSTATIFFDHTPFYHSKKHVLSAPQIPI